MRTKFKVGLTILTAGMFFCVCCAGLNGEEGKQRKRDADVSLKRSGNSLNGKSSEEEKVKSIDRTRKKKNVKKKKRDINKDLAVCNLSAGDLAGGGLSHGEEKNFSRAENFLRGKKNLPDALGILEGIRINLGEKQGVGVSCVNLSIARAYFLQGDYRVSLKYSHRAIQSGMDYSKVWMKSAFLAGLSYLKLGEKRKADIMFDMIVRKAEKYPVIARLALIYSGKLTEPSQICPKPDPRRFVPNLTVGTSCGDKPPEEKTESMEKNGKNKKFGVEQDED